MRWAGRIARSNIVMKVQVLIENTIESSNNTNLKQEHGLSIFIKYKDKKILLDAGTTSAFMENAKNMDVDIENADFCVLSHGHYDHSGGFAKYLEENHNKKVYAMKTSIEEYYSGSGGHIHEIGVPKEVYPKYKDNFILIDEAFVDKGVEISEGIFIIPHNTKGLEKIGERAKLYKKVDDDYVPDDFSHELSLVFDTEKGLVVFNSCSHSGIINTMEEIKKYFGNRAIYAFFGGLHMKGMKDNVEICTFSEAEIEGMADYLKQNGLTKLYTGHCTGLVGFKLIKNYMQDGVEYINTGKTISIN